MFRFHRKSFFTIQTIFHVGKNSACRYLDYSHLPKNHFSSFSSLKQLSITPKKPNESEFVEGHMLIKFDCKVCSTTNAKFMSKHAYTKGVVIIKCDGCSNHHLIADHLGWFDSQKPPGTIEDILKRSGRQNDAKRLEFNQDLGLPVNAMSMEWIPSQKADE